MPPGPKISKISYQFNVTNVFNVIYVLFVNQAILPCNQLMSCSVCLIVNKVFKKKLQKKQNKKQVLYTNVCLWVNRFLCCKKKIKK